MSSYNVVKVIFYKECAVILMALNLLLSVGSKEFYAENDGQIMCD
jgi:hypothetical protein